MTTTNDTTPAAEPVPVTDPQEGQEVNARRELVDIDPALLLVDRNIREAHLDKPFLASVKRHGVLVPIVAVRTPDGLRVRMGNRRTLAAVQTARPTVPVLVTGAEDDDHAARIVAQWTENEHRTALTNAERVEAVHQLSLYGLSAAQIATRTAAPKATVAAALTVAGNELAAKAAIRYEFLTLEQAATLTRFERDTETVTALVAAAKLGPVQFDRVVAKADADAAEVAADQARRDRAAAALAEAGCRVIDQPQTGDGTARLSRLLDAATGKDLTPENHATCPGHAAWLDGDWEPVPEGDDDPDADEDGYRPVYVAVYVCTEPHRHRDRWATTSRASTSTSTADTASSNDADDYAAAAQARAEQQKAEQAAHRREVIANNKAWRQCEPIRRAWLCALLARKTAPKGTAAFLAATLAQDTDTNGKPEVHAHPSDLLALAGNADVSAYAAAQSDARALVVATAVAVARYENGLSIESWRKDSWRGRSRAAARYFTWLAANGYPLSEVERLAGGLPVDDPIGDNSAGNDSADAEVGESEQDGMVA